MISIPTLVNCDVVTCVHYSCSVFAVACHYSYKLVIPVSEHSVGRTLRSKMRCVLKATKTLDSGYLGSRNDEERSEMRYVV